MENYKHSRRNHRKISSQSWGRQSFPKESTESISRKKENKNLNKHFIKNIHKWPIDTGKMLDIMFSYNFKAQGDATHPLARKVKSKENQNSKLSFIAWGSIKMM